MSPAALLRVESLARPGLGPVSFSLAAGELVCLSGPSGAGKTLLLRAIADLDVTTGDVLLDQVPRASIPPVQWRRQVAFLPAESRWWAPTVGAHFAQSPTELFARLGFDAGVAEWKPERLSSGERQRLALLRLLANTPRVLLLDEPTANLDAASAGRVERLVRDYIDEQRAACLWVTHDGAQIARIADGALHLDGGGLRRGAAA